MTKYEVMVIITNQLSDKDAETHAQTGVVEKIKSLGGTMTFEDFWGTRGFAYMINGEKWGYYFVGQFDIDPQAITEMKNDWNIDNQIVRFIITKVTKYAAAPRSHEEMKKEWEALEKESKISEAESPKKSAASAPAKAKTAAAAPAATKDEAPAAKPAEKAAPEKKDAVDKKLDAILEDSSLDL